MTLDEAIVHAREVASEERRRSGICVQNDSECDKFSTCLKCAEEHEQLAEWLEELKYYKNDYGDIVSKIATFEADKLKIYNCGYILGYIKGINDLISKCGGIITDTPNIEKLESVDINGEILYKKVTHAVDYNLAVNVITKDTFIKLLEGV